MLDLRVINNGDHACIAWRPSGDPRTWTKIQDCRGFAVQRRLQRNDQTTLTWLRNRVGFSHDQAAPPPEEAWRWPIQRYLWWDYDVLPNDEVAYRVIPVTGPASKLVLGALREDEGWTITQPISSNFGAGLNAYFNRGVIATPWVTRALHDQATGRAPRTVLLDAVEELGNPLRDELGGVLKSSLLKQLHEAPGPVYAALYELNDPEVVAAIKALGNRFFLILGNGAFKTGKPDENAEIRASLRKTSVNVFDRIVTGEHFAHNKFFVFCDPKGAPISVFTGSTNCTITGLCTQVNNGLLVSHKGVAEAYLDAWQRLHQSGNQYPPSLRKANSVARQFDLDAGISASVWFAPTDDAEDLDQARKLINQAREGILFLFFNPGHFETDPHKWTLLQTVLNRHAKAPNPYYNAELYVRGVVNQEIPQLTAPNPGALNPPSAGAWSAAPHAELDPSATTQPVALFRDGDAPPVRMPRDVLVPAAIKSKYGEWEAELKGASQVMVHSKVVVLDPFGDHPVVMTGSHNLGFKASHSNDDNLIIVEGDAALAQAYAANIIAIFQEYRWRDYVAHHQADPHAWKGLDDDDAWQAGHFAREVREMMFWTP